jgi:NADH/NAD ratio-sensing transcriptional regulator Rex
MNDDKYYREQLMRIAWQIIYAAPGRARLACQEADASMAVVKDAAHFIKVDENRIGRDIELYGMFGKDLRGWQQALLAFLDEVLLPIRSLGLEASYNTASVSLRQLGYEVFDITIQHEWDNLFQVK